MKTDSKQTIISFAWKQPDEDCEPPRLYGRVEVALGDRIIEGIVSKMLWVERPLNQLPTYRIRISVAEDLTGEDLSDIAVRVV